MKRHVFVGIEVDQDVSEELILTTEQVLEWELTIREVTLIHGTEPEPHRVPGNAYVGKGALRPGLVASVEPVSAFSVGAIIEDHIESLER